MKRSLVVVAILFVMMSGSVFADQIFFDTNVAGSNFAAIVNDGGTRILVFGGVAYDFFNQGPYAPGSTLGGFTDLFIDGGFAQSGGNFYDLSPNGFGTLFLSSITLPTNGKDYRALTGIDFFAPMAFVDTGEPLDVVGDASGSITFHFFNGSYYADPFVMAPEPTTMVLFGTGLGVIGWRRYKGARWQ